jgi:tetratricopeptide (TPR) repeat protein
MSRSAAITLLIGLTIGAVHAQQSEDTAPQSVPATRSTEAEFPSRPELLRRIDVYEGLAQQAKTSHSTNASLLKIYSQLGILYADAGMFSKSEAAMERAVAMMQAGPKDQLAVALGHLAEVHIALGDMHQAEKEQLEALRIRAGVGDPIGIALARSDLAALYVRERKYAKALELATQAMDVIGDNQLAEVTDRIAIRQILATALCDCHDCARAVPLLKDAIDSATNAFGPDSLSVGIASSVLGYVYWRSGDLADASAWMEQGIAKMKADLGWGHPIYLNAVSVYAKLLRQLGHMEEADTAEREVRQAHSVVDARSFVARAQ